MSGRAPSGPRSGASAATGEDGVSGRSVTARANLARFGADEGTMALEMALLTPLLVAFMMLMVGLGRVVEAQSQVDGAARDAARAASLGRTRAGAQTAAVDAAGATLSGKKCRRGPRTSVDFSQWRRGGQVSVAVHCDVDLSGLSLIGLTPTKTMTGTATAPIDTLRRVE